MKSYKTVVEEEPQGSAVDVSEQVERDAGDDTKGLVMSLELIRQTARAARDDGYYRKLFALTLFMAGDRDLYSEVSGVSLSAGATYGDPDLPDFPTFDAPLLDDGIVNHQQISSRINIQSIVYADPEVEFVTELTNVKEINLAWLRKRWNDGRWQGKFYEIGIDVETYGYGCALLGINGSGAFDLKRVSPLDVMHASLDRSASEWGTTGVFIRNRLTVEQAAAKYPTIGMYRIVNLARRRFHSASWNKFFGTDASLGDDRLVVYEWQFWSDSTHCSFIGGIQEGGVCMRLALNEEDGTYSYIEGSPGPNPFGEVPLAFWEDSWVSGSGRHVGKAETTMPIAKQLNNIEVAMREGVKRGLPMTVVSTIGMKPHIIKALEESQDYEQMGKLILTESDEAARNIHRVAPLEISQTSLAQRAQLKEEMAGSTGVLDSQRGVLQKGERTAYEFRETQGQGGVQSRHLRKRFADMLYAVIEKGRRFAAAFESRSDRLVLADGLVVDTSDIPMQAVLSEPMELRIHEESLVYRTEDQKFSRRLMQFQQVDLPLMQAGVVDKFKVAEDLYRSLGMRDPLKLFVQQQAQTAPPGITMPGQQAGQPPL